jgi:hypothetical protein
MRIPGADLAADLPKQEHYCDGRKRSEPADQQFMPILRQPTGCVRGPQDALVHAARSWPLRRSEIKLRASAACLAGFRES